jgi:ABC-type Mn2+/Zn2+ transport systems, permease components
VSPEFVIALTAALAACACALAGVFLVLRRMALMADAISHAILPGLVAGYWMARGPNVVAGFLGATAAGLLTVWLTEALTRSRRVKEDTAIGLVFPALFALGVLLVSRFFSNVHLDTDAVLFGEIAFAPLETWRIGGRDLGPTALWTLGGLTALNAGFLALFYKELKLSTFDPGLAAALGFAPVLLHYGLMGMVAVTTVGGFTAVGAILVIALIIVPPVTASLLTDRLPALVALSVAVGVAGALAGYGLAAFWDVSIGGMIVTVLGALFGATLLLAPRKGLVAQAVRRARQRRQFAREALLVHLATHEGTAAEDRECRPAHLQEELLWTAAMADRAVAEAQSAGLVAPVDAEGHLHLTDRGREMAAEVSRK